MSGKVGRALSVLMLSCLMAATAAWAQGGSVKGSVAYSAEMAWDYNKDGQIKRVQYWIDLDLETDGETVTGSAVKYLKNLDSGEKIYDLVQLDMTGNNSRRLEVVTKLVIHGQTAEITMNDIVYTVRDSSSYAAGEKPTFVAFDGTNRAVFPIYAGRVEVRQLDQGAPRPPAKLAP